MDGCAPLPRRRYPKVWLRLCHQVSTLSTLKSTFQHLRASYLAVILYIFPFDACRTTQLFEKQLDVLLITYCVYQATVHCWYQAADKIFKIGDKTLAGEADRQTLPTDPAHRRPMCRRYLRPIRHRRLQTMRLVLLNFSRPSTAQETVCTMSNTRLEAQVFFRSWRLGMIEDGISSW